MLILKGRNTSSAMILEASGQLGYFKEYPYFHEATRLYVEQHEGAEVEQARFAKLLGTIDRKITKNYDAEACTT